MAEHQRIAAPAATPNALRDRMMRYRAIRCTLDASWAQRFSRPFPRLCRTCSVFEIGTRTRTCTWNHGR